MASSTEEKGAAAPSPPLDQPVELAPVPVLQPAKSTAAVIAISPVAAAAATAEATHEADVNECSGGSAELPFFVWFQSHVWRVECREADTIQSLIRRTVRAAAVAAAAAAAADVALHAGTGAVDWTADYTLADMKMYSGLNSAVARHPLSAPLRLADVFGESPILGARGAVSELAHDATIAGCRLTASTPLTLLRCPVLSVVVHVTYPVANAARLASAAHAASVSRVVVAGETRQSAIQLFVSQPARFQDLYAAVAAYIRCPDMPTARLGLSLASSFGCGVPYNPWAFLADSGVRDGTELVVRLHDTRDPRNGHPWFSVAAEIVEPPPSQSDSIVTAAAAAAAFATPDNIESLQLAGVESSPSSRSTSARCATEPLPRVEHAISIIVRMLNVDGSVGLPLPVVCSPATRLATVKKYISDAKGIAVSDQRLIVGRRVLPDDDACLIADCILPSDATVFLVVKERAFQLFVRTLCGRVRVMECCPTLTVRTLKEQIHASEFVPPAEQRLVYANQPLEDDRPIADYDIGAEAIITLCLRLRNSL